MAVKKKPLALKRLINKIEKVTPVRPATEEELAALQKLAGGKLPEEAMEFYSKYSFEGIVRIDKEIDLYGINEIVRANTDAVPGFMVLPFGLLTVASWVDGDAICIDLNSVGEKLWNGRCYTSQVIRQCSHELFSEGEEITFYRKALGGLVRLPYTRENVVALSPYVTYDFNYLLQDLRDGDLRYIGLTDTLEDYEKKRLKETSQEN